MEETFRLRFLGTVQVEREGQPVRGFRSRKALALLGYLAMQDQPVPREHLADLFWGDQPEARGRANLSWVLNKVSTLLPGCVQADRHTVQFQRVAPYWLDIDAFEQLETRRDPDSLAAAVELYRGEFLEGLYLAGCAEFEIWLVKERERWRQRVTDVLGELVTHHSQQGEYKQGLRFAQRLLALEPWQEETHRQAMRLLAGGGQRGAALAQYETCHRILAEELGVEPAPETTSLYEQIRTGQSGGPESLSPAPPLHRPPTPRHNLPTLSTPFIGREAVLAEITERLEDSDCRLLTLVGPGGSGKTRLALEASVAQLDNFPHGVFFVNLAPLDAVEAMVPTVAKALDFSFYEGGEPRQQLLDYVRQKTMLLLMDNFEHLLDGVGLVTDILTTAPEMKILATSRARLNIQGEHLFPVAGMDFPDVETAEELALSLPKNAGRYSAIELFLSSAHRTQPDFAPTAEEMTNITHICRLVRGMPLGIELAAAWMAALTPAEVAAEISQSFDFLETDLRDVPERQRSMRAIFDHSWRLLTEREREVFQSLSVFRGGFTREAAQEITGVSLRELMVLVNKSLLQRMPTGRYEIHELLRQYAAEKLTERPPEKADIQQKHSAYYFEFLKQQQIALREDDRPDKTVLATIDVEIANIRVAWQWLLAQGVIKTITVFLDCLWLFYKHKNQYQEAVSVFNQACSLEIASSQLKAHWQRLLGEAQFGLGNLLESRQHLQKALALLGSSTPQPRLRLVAGILRQLVRQGLHRMWPSWFVGYAQDNRAHHLEVVRTLERLLETYVYDNQVRLSLVYELIRALNLAEAAGHSPELARIYAGFGILSGIVLRQHALARAYLRWAQDIAQGTTDLATLAWLQFLTGGYYGGIGRWKQAEGGLEQAIKIYNQIDDQAHWIDVVIGLSWIRLFQGKFASAAEGFATSVVIGQESGHSAFLAAGLTGQAMVALRLECDGGADEAMTHAKAALNLLDENADRSFQIMANGVLAIAYSRRGECQSAYEAAKKGLYLIADTLPIGFHAMEGYVGVAETYLILWENNGKQQPLIGSQILAKSAWQACKALHKFARAIPVGQPRAWLWQGLYEWLAGRHCKAHRAWQKSLTHAQRLDMPYEEGLAHCEIGRHLPVEDSRRYTHLSQAIEVLDRLGAVYDLERAQEALRLSE